MSQSDQRLYIYNAVNGVTDIGNVYDRQRWAMKWKDIVSLLKVQVDGTDQLRSWMITCSGYRDAYLHDQEIRSGEGKVAVARTYTWTIRGFVTFNDGDNTEEEALELATLVTGALTTSSDIHDGYNFWGEQPPASLDIFELRLVSGVLCHYAEIRQELTEVVALGG